MKLLLVIVMSFIYGTGYANTESTIYGNIITIEETENTDIEAYFSQKAGNHQPASQPARQETIEKGVAPPSITNEDSKDESEPNFSEEPSLFKKTYRIFFDDRINETKELYQEKKYSEGLDLIKAYYEDTPENDILVVCELLTKGYIATQKYDDFWEHSLDQRCETSEVVQSLLAEQKQRLIGNKESSEMLTLVKEHPSSILVLNELVIYLFTYAPDRDITLINESLLGEDIRDELLAAMNTTSEQMIKYRNAEQLWSLYQEENARPILEAYHKALLSDEIENKSYLIESKENDILSSLRLLGEESTIRVIQSVINEGKQTNILKQITAGELNKLSDKAKTTLAKASFKEALTSNRIACNDQFNYLMTDAGLVLSAEEITSSKELLSNALHNQNESCLKVWAKLLSNQTKDETWIVQATSAFAAHQVIFENTHKQLQVIRDQLESKNLAEEKEEPTNLEKFAQKLGPCGGLLGCEAPESGLILSKDTRTFEWIEPGKVREFGKIVTIHNSIVVGETGRYLIEYQNGVDGWNRTKIRSQIGELVIAKPIVKSEPALDETSQDNTQPTPPKQVSEGEESGQKPNYPYRQIQSIQVSLQHLGYYYGRVDGLFGKKTSKAISKYQLDNGFTVTGKPSKHLETTLIQTARNTPRIVKPTASKRTVDEPTIGKKIGNAIDDFLHVLRKNDTTSQ